MATRRRAESALADPPPRGRAPRAARWRAVEARGKHLLAHFSGDLVLHSHLGMNGRWWITARRPPAVRTAMAAPGERPGIASQNGGKILRVVTESKLRNDPSLRRLGPDPSAAGFEPEVAAQRLRSGAALREIGDALLDQELIAGIGNVIRVEALFRARVSPWRKVSDLSDEELLAVVAREQERDGHLDGEGPAPEGDLQGAPQGLPQLRRRGALARAGRRQPHRVLVPALPDVTKRDTGSAMAPDPAELIARVPLFAELSQDELERIGSVAIPRAFPKGVRIFHEGDHSDACYIVCEGDLRVTREHSDGRAIALATLGPGDIFGELAMLDGGVRSASVETLTDAELLGLPASDVRRVIAGHGDIAAKLIVALTRRLRETNERVSRQSFQTVPSRVAGVLVPADRRGDRPRGAPRDHGADDPGRPRAARRDLARERQPLPRDARASRRGRRRPRPGDRARATATARLHLLTELSAPNVSASAWWSASFARRGISDERVLAAMGEVPRERFVDEQPRAPRLRRLGAAARGRADDLPALGRRGDLRGAGAARRRARARGRHRLGLLGGGARSARRGRCSASSAFPSSRRAPAATSPASRVPSGSRCASATEPSARPTRRPSTRSRSTPRRPRRRRAWSPSSHHGGRLVVPVTEGRADVLTVFTAGDAGLAERVIAPCRFVPLVGQEGYSDRGA